MAKSTTSFHSQLQTFGKQDQVGTEAQIIGNYSEQFFNLPSREPIDMEFKDLSLTATLGFNKEPKEILHQLCGKLPGNQLIAIMGPSGAGKSTLLDVLSGFRTTGVHGSILLNGRRRDLTTFRKMSCYITQDDMLQPLLTVCENMHIAADLKLNPKTSAREKESLPELNDIQAIYSVHRNDDQALHGIAIMNQQLFQCVKQLSSFVKIEDILILLGIYEHENTMTRLLSGGQKKRLSIAMELINNPTVMFLDEPTTGLDSSSCAKVLQVLKKLALEGRTIICTVHQPTAKLFRIFDQVYVLSIGNCVYQGSPKKLISFLQAVNLPCPVYHNPADYIIELACGEYGKEKIHILKSATVNGKCLRFFNNPGAIMKVELLRRKHEVLQRFNGPSLENTSFANQLSVLMKRGYIKFKRDITLTHLRIGVNIFVAIILGSLYANSGREGSKVLDNYNLLFAILIHHSMTTMMLTVLTFPIEMSILLKEHFNRWYSLKAFYTAINLLDLPISIFASLLFTIIIYLWTYQPMEWFRFWMFFSISVLSVIVGQSFGLIIGAWFNVVNGTFLAPVLTIPMMMFAGFGVTLKDLPNYLKWGSHVSYLRYGLEGFVGAIYGGNRDVMDCNEALYCHYRYPKKFLDEITMSGERYWFDLMALFIIGILFKVTAFLVLRAKIYSVK